MRKEWKKILELLLAVSACVLMFSLVAGAEPLYPKTQYYYLAGKSVDCSGTLVITGIPTNQKIEKSSVKSSDGSVARLKKLNSSIVYEEEATLDKLPVSEAKYTKKYTIEMEFRKAGTSKITFQIGKKKYTSVVRVLPYRNVISSLTISGIRNGNSTNLAGKFAKSARASVKLPKAQKNGMISVKAASGWKISSIHYMADGRNRMLTSERGVTSATLFTGTMSSGESFRTVTIKMKNSKTGAEIEYNCDIG